MRHKLPARPLGRTLLVTASLATFGVAGESLGLGRAGAAGGPPTKAQAKTFADAVNLKAGDIPGFKAGSVSKLTAADLRTGAAIARCTGGVDPRRAIVDASSPDFHRAAGVVQQDISSDVEVLPSAALVAKDIKSVKSARGRRCVAAAFQKAFNATKITGVKFGKVTTTSAPVQANGASGSFALRFTINATIHGQKIPYYSDLLGFSLGRAEVTLTALGFGTPVASTDELGLFSVLLRRAEAVPTL